VGMARKSRLVEILAGQMLMASADALAAHPNPPASPDHASMLNLAEKRLVNEWIDTGAKYYNDPFNPASGVRSVATLDQVTFTNVIEPILMKTCAASCHEGIGSNQTTPLGKSFVENRFVLSGDPNGDFNVTLTMITDTCNPPSNYLLLRPSTIPHPASAGTTQPPQTTAVLPQGSADYTTISNWIASGCPIP